EVPSAPLSEPSGDGAVRLVGSPHDVLAGRIDARASVVAPTTGFFFFRFTRAAEVRLGGFRGGEQDRGVHGAERGRADSGLCHHLHQRGAAAGVVVHYRTPREGRRDGAVERELARV